MCSIPPARAMSIAPSAISPAAAVTAVRAPAHIRSTAKPGTESGIPARSATSRPSVSPWSPTCAVAARTTSPIRSGGIPGLRRKSSRTALTPMSSARVRQYWPLGPALPNGVRKPSTKKTSRASRIAIHDTAAVEWSERADAAIERYEAGETRGLDQRQFTQLGNAAWAAGLSLLMSGQTSGAADWLRRAAQRYRDSWDGTPPDSWGRPIAAMKALVLAGDDGVEAARWALDAGAAEAESPIGRYAGTLALLVLGDDVGARILGSTLRDRADFPAAVADALVEVAGNDRVDYQIALEHILDSFEQRTDFLEDVP